MFSGNFGRPPPMGQDEDDDDDDGSEAEARQAAAAMLGSGQAPGNMNELLASMLGAQRPGVAEQEEEEDDEDIDETTTERLIGLTEMFPEGVRRVMASVVGGSLSAAKWTWVNGQSLAWAITATCMIAIMPVVLERERHQFQQEQLAQQRQILLGPGATPTQAGHSMYGGLLPAAGMK